MSLSFHALYSDGRKYGAFLEGGQTFLRTTDGGKMPVPWRVEAGEFVRYGCDYCAPPGLRGCDWAENARQFTAEVALFIAPQKPATEPTPQTEPDATRVRLLPREPGESKLSQLQRSVSADVMQTRVERRNAHQNQSAEAMSEAGRRDAAKVAAARRLASDALHARQRPNYGVSGQPGN
jgi:hypothetical protein